MYWRRPQAMPHPRAKIIPNLPSTFISIEEQDLLRDEAIEYAQRLMQAGINTELHVYPGTFHGSFIVVPEADVSQQHMSDVVNSLKKALSRNNDNQSVTQVAEEDQSATDG